MNDKKITLKTLEGGERTFTVGPLVPMQLIQLQTYLGLSLTDISRENLMAVFNDTSKLITFFAIIANEENIPLEKKNVDEIINLLGYGIDIPTMLEAADFFSRNMKPILADLTKQMEKLIQARNLTAKKDAKSKD